MLSGEELARRDRLAALQSAGIDPYPSTVERTHTIKDVLAHFESMEKSGDVVKVVGRVYAIRQMGGLTFIRLQDGTESMQMVLKQDVVGDTVYEQFGKLVDVGDFLGFTGILFVTKKGERSVAATSWSMLTKALAPMPEKWHGIQDIEIRYRHRELDLISNPEVRERFIVRSKLVSSMRRFLDERGFLEVETPILQPIPGGANAKPFITHHNALGSEFYLRIAPELYLKRLLVGGFEKVYEIGRCFRNEGIDYSHNPEFSMIELYWAFVNKEAFVQFLEELMTYVIKESVGSLEVPYGESAINFSAPWSRMTFREAILKDTGIDIDTLATPEEVAQAAHAKGLDIDFSGCIGIGECFDELWKKTARPKIAQPTWIFDYPVQLKPLAKALRDDPTKSAAVQLVVQGAEVFNAYYHELNDPIDQRRRFEEQQAFREQGSEEAQWMDEDFLSALEHGMPPASGVGIGIERLVAFITNAPNLKEVMLFPTLKPKPAAKPTPKKEDDVFGAIKTKLEKAGVEYLTKHHGDRPEDSDTALGFDPTKRPHHNGAKAIVVKGKKSKKLFHVVLPDDCKLDQGKVTAVIGEKFSFASADELIAATGCVPGSVPPFGSVLGMDTHVDLKLKDNEEIFFNAGLLTDSIRMKLTDYLAVEQPKEVDVTV